VKCRMAILVVAAVAAGSISACGGGGGGGGDSGPAMATAMPPPPSVTHQSLDTAQVLAQARHTSETSSPYPVNDDALVLTDTRDTTEPVSINGS
jgi:hypothetical protein